MRLIHLIANHNRHPTGMTTVFAEIADQARERGWSFEIVIPGQADGAGWVEMLVERGATVHVVDFGPTRTVARQLSELLDQDLQPTICHTHLSVYDLPATIACWRKANVALIWHVHSVLPEGRVRQVRARVKFSTFGRRIDQVVIPFENSKDDLVRRGVDPAKVILFPGCVDPAEFPLRDAEERRLVRERLGVPSSSFLLLHFGWYWYEKGGEEFLQTVRLLTDAGLPVIAIINRGGAPAEEARTRLGLEEVVRVEGLVEDSRPLYVAADCMVGPSRAEGLTFSYLEGLATGLPVVATNLPGRHYLYDHLKACIIATRDKRSLASAVREILERTTEETAAAAIEARSWIIEERSVRPTVASLFDDYERVAKSRAGR